MEVRKFIIYDNQIRMGLVELHVDLLPKGFDRSLVKGGGRWEYKPDTFGNKVFFFGHSFDFGPCTKDDFFAAWDNSYISPSLESAEINFSEHEYFSDVLKHLNVPIQ
jgi:hypothetical protein